MKKSTDILNTITTEFELFKAEAEKYDQKNNKAAGVNFSFVDSMLKFNIVCTIITFRF